MGNSLPHSERSAKKLPPTYFGVGDDAFVNSDTLLTPWSGRGLTIFQDSFNYHLSSMRQTIERAFGIFIRRWGIFNRPLTVALNKWGFLADVCARLHNYCIRLRQGEPPTRMAVDIQPGDVPQVIFNEERDGDARLEGLRRSRRQEITQTLAERGVARP
jgi:hypothetical protein